MMLALWMALILARLLSTAYWNAYSATRVDAVRVITYLCFLFCFLVFVFLVMVVVVVVVVFVCLLVCLSGSLPRRPYINPPNNEQQTTTHTQTKSNAP